MLPSPQLQSNLIPGLNLNALGLFPSGAPGMGPSMSSVPPPGALGGCSSFGVGDSFQYLYRFVACLLHSTNLRPTAYFISALLRYEGYQWLHSLVKALTLTHKVDLGRVVLKAPLRVIETESPLKNMPLFAFFFFFPSLFSSSVAAFTLEHEC